VRNAVLALCLSSLSSLAPCSSPDAGGGGPGPAASAALPPCTPAPLPAPAPDSPDLALARRVADHYVAAHPAESLAWDWSEGVLIGAMADLYRRTGVATYGDYAKAYLAYHAAHGYTVLASDRCAPAIGAATLEATTCDTSQREEVQSVVDYLDHVAMRDDKGGISHFGGSTLFGATVWIDSLTMYGEVLIRAGESTGDARLLDLYGQQFLITTAELQDASGFYTHAANWPGQTPGVFWARGNSWVITSGFDYLRVRKARGETDDAVAAPLKKLAAAIVSTQDAATGLWWSVPSHPGEIYLETSASALFALGLARGYHVGVLDASVVPVIKKAMDGVKTKIVNDVVTDISGPTDAGDFQNYANVPLGSDFPFGVGGVILALMETADL
jgi:unsaturated rhamnogalacturonyl hydrolase